MLLFIVTPYTMSLSFLRIFNIKIRNGFFHVAWCPLTTGWYTIAFNINK